MIGLKNLVPPSQQITSKTKTNLDLLVQVFLHFVYCIEFWLDNGFCVLWLPRVITLVLVLWHSIERCSKELPSKSISCCPQIAIYGELAQPAGNIYKYVFGKFGSRVKKNGISTKMVSRKTGIALRPESERTCSFMVSLLPLSTYFSLTFLCTSCSRVIKQLG